MSVIAGVAKAAGAKVLTGTTPARKVLPKTKGTLVVMALALLALATLISASETVNVGHSPAASTNSEAAAAPVSQPAAAPQMSEKEALDAYGKLPLSFVPNEGQSTDEAVRYYAQGAGYGFFFTKEGATLSFAEGKGRGHALGLDFLGANPHATLTARKRLPGKVNYLVGDDPAKWQQGLPTHAELLYGGLWPGIDMAARGEGGKLKYEFLLQPGSSVEDVRLAYRGAEGLSVGAGGQLLVRTSLGVLKDAAPVSYQRIGGERVPVESRYKLDGEGRAYVTGTTLSANYPTTPGAFDTTFNGREDAFVTKLNASGSALAYSTFLGGSDLDQGLGIAVREGRVYVTGRTESPNYPTTPGAFDTTFNGNRDAFVTKLNASGSALVYSTFLGGSDLDQGESIAVDREGRAYVTGLTQSADFPTTLGAFDRTFNGPK